MVLCQKHFQNKKDTRGAVFFGTGARGRGAPCPLAPPLVDTTIL